MLFAPYVHKLAWEKLIKTLKFKIRCSHTSDKNIQIGIHIPY
jgi:hypothetical protein